MVIQRWQSVLLLIAGVMMGLFSFLSLGQVQLPNLSLNFTALGFSVEGIPTNGGPAGYVLHTVPLFAVSLLSALLSLLAIFMFKNMQLQKKLCYFTVFFIVAACCVAAVYGYRSFPGASASWSSLVIAPVVALVAVLAALKCINSDQRKLRSIDRIR